ncbi:MAG: glycosyltransferase family 4 protein [Acidobacteria bacterium]|nr:glycosyltransferase family 4 protein [Acidobacteriota bacterium]MDW7984068.1 glycosyltransferase family 4 protein [Acidobacteriota bacterium]
MAIRSLYQTSASLSIGVPAYRQEPTEIKRLGNLFVFPHDDIEALGTAIETTDLILVVGDLTDPAPTGPDTLLTPRHGGLRYIEGVTWLASCLGIPVMLYGVRVLLSDGPDEAHCLLAICQAARAIMVRNRHSAYILQRLGVPPDRIDVAVFPHHWTKQALEFMARPSEALPPEVRRPILEGLWCRVEPNYRPTTWAPLYDMASVRPALSAFTVPRRGDLVRVIAPQFFDLSGQQVIFGGAERYLVELTKIFRDMGADVEVVQMATDRGWERSAFGFPVRGIPARDFFDIESALYRLGAPRPALTVHLAFFTASRVTPPPAIGISHSVFWDQAFYQRPEIFQTHQDRLLEALEFLDTLVANDANMINWLRTISVRLAEKCVRIPNFVDLQQFSPRGQPDARNGDRVVILFPRRLAADRGFWLMAQLIPDLIRDHPEVTVELVGSAAGEKERQEAERLTTQFPRHVRWRVVPFEKMPQVYRSADIAVIPPLCSEGTALACLEAMASGNAVVATRVGGLPELIIDGYNGLLVEPTASAIRGALERLIGDAHLRVRLGRQAIETARAFDIALWRERWRNILRTFIVLA